MGTQIYVLNPEYVRKEVEKDPEHRSLWRASRLGSFSNDSSFSAYDRDVDFHSALRGVRRVVAVGDAPEKSEVPVTPQEMTLDHCYEKLLADPKGAVAALSDARAAGLSRLLTVYLTTKVP